MSDLLERIVREITALRDRVGRLETQEVVVRTLANTWTALQTFSAGIRLPNAVWLVGRNAANDADVNLIRLNASNRIELGTSLEALNVGAVTGAATGDGRFSGNIYWQLGSVNGLLSSRSEPNNNTYPNIIGRQQGGLFIKDRPAAGGLWLNGIDYNVNGNVGGVGAGACSDFGTWWPLYTSASAIIFQNGTIKLFADNGLTVGQGYWPSPKMTLLPNGNVLIGTTTDASGVRMQVVGGRTATQNDGNTVLSVDRLTNDGTLISLQRQNAEKGTISVSGETVSYNAFTGSHYAWSQQAIERGQVVVLTGENRYLHDDPTSEVVYGVERSRRANDPAVLGVMLGRLNPEDPIDASNPLIVAAVGNATCWVIDTGRDLEPGDLLVSSEVPGYAMVVRDDQAVAHVFARGAERVEWANVSQSIDVGGMPRKIKQVSVLLGAFRVG